MMLLRRVFLSLFVLLALLLSSSILNAAALDVEPYNLTNSQDSPRPTNVSLPKQKLPASVMDSWVIGYAGTPPALDGDLSEWSGIGSVVLDRDTAAVLSGTTPERTDAMTTMQMAWSENGLYLAIHTRDDVLVHDSVDLAEDDAFQLAIDGNSDGAGGSAKDHLYAIAQDGRRTDLGAAAKGLTVATKSVPTGYNLEILIPTSRLNLGTLNSGMSFNFNWALVDDDDGAAADTVMIWRGSRIGSPETTWPTLSLGEGAVEFTGLVEAGLWEWYSGGKLNDVFAIDSEYAWAVGNGVWQTTDGGTHWQRYPMLFNTTPQRVIFVDRNRGWVVDEDGRVLRTEDGGRSWVLALAGMYELVDFDASPPDSVWVVQRRPEDRDSIPESFGSTDGGLSWSSGPWFEDLDSLDVYDRDHIWIISPKFGVSDGKLKHVLTQTADAGKTWVNWPIVGISNDILPDGLSFGSLAHGWIVARTDAGHANSVWKTTDGGHTWTKQLETEEGEFWQEGHVQALDERVAWFGEGNAWWRTTDGGASWVKRTDSGPTRAYFRTMSEGWGVKDGRILKSSTGGATWITVLSLPDRPYPYFWNHLTGWRVVGSVIEHTTDGGSTWVGTATGLPSVDHYQFVDALNGWAWHDASLGLRHTTDGGTTWTTQTTGSDVLTDLQFVDQTHGWVRQSTGQLRRTANGGNTWRDSGSPPLPTPEPGLTNWISVNQVFFLNWKQGWATIQHEVWELDDCRPKTSYTTDGGDTWSSLRYGPNEEVIFVDARNGWGRFGCFGHRVYESHLMRTSDGGSSWANLPPYSSIIHTIPTHLYMIDVEQGWGFFLKDWLARNASTETEQGWKQKDGAPAVITFDGGETWTSQRGEAPDMNPRSIPGRIPQVSGEPGGVLLRYRNTEIVARRAQQPPVIDGSLEDWARVPTYSLKADIAYKVEGQTPTPLDSSAVLQAAWDDTHLYFALRVYDDTIIVDDLAKPWLDDYVEIALDGDHDHLRRWDADYYDHQFGVNANGVLYDDGYQVTGPGVARTRILPGGYTIEVAIPKASLGAISPMSGQVLGFNWSLSDDDEWRQRRQLASLAWTRNFRRRCGVGPAADERARGAICERAAHRDTHGNPYCNDDTHGQRDAHAHPDSDHDLHPHGDGYCHTFDHAIHDTNRYADADANLDSIHHADTHQRPR